MKKASILGWSIVLLFGWFQVNGQIIVDNTNTQSEVVMNHAELQNFLETVIKARKARMMHARYYYYRQQYANQQPPQQENAKELAEMQTLLRELDTKMQSSNSAVERKELEQMRYEILEEMRATQTSPNVTIHNTIQADTNRIAYAQPTPDNRDLEAELERIRRELKKDRKPRRSKTINKDYTYSDGKEEYEALKKRIRELEQQQTTTPQTPQPPQVIIKEVPKIVKTQDDRQYNELLTKYQELASQLNNRPITDNSLSDRRYNDLLSKYESLLRDINNKPAPEPKIIYRETITTTPRLEEKEWFNNRRVIYFDNASHALHSASNALLDEIAGLMTRHASLKVVIKGFASKKGTPEYNLLLSERRSSSIRTGLIRRGIDASRITSDFHGIDYRPANEQEARRAEIIFLAN